MSSTSLGTPSSGYSKKTVEEIVRRMKKMYIERGLSEEEASAKALKGAVAGSRAMEVETKGPEEFISNKNVILKIIGEIFSVPQLSKIVSKLGEKDFSVELMRQLDSANMNFSTTQYIAISLFASFVAAAFISFIPFAIFIDNVVSAIIYGFITFVISLPLSFFVAIKWPASVAKKRGSAIDRVLPFALRHMATEIKAGIGIHDSMKDIANAGYGVLSEEFERVIQDMDKGMTTEDAIEALAERSPSDSLAASAQHITRAIRIGGNLADILSEIAQDVSFDLRMRMRDFVEKLSLISLFYMMAGIVMPVFFTILVAIFNAIPSLGFQGIIGPGMLMLVYVILIPLTLGLILYVVSVTQPM